MSIRCPRCGKSDCVQLKTPDYGYGYGTEFACYRCDPYGARFISRGPEAKAVSDAALGAIIGEQVGV